MIKNEQEYYAALKEVSPLYDLDPVEGTRNSERTHKIPHETEVKFGCHRTPNRFAELRTL